MIWAPCRTKTPKSTVLELEVRAKAALAGSPTANALAKYTPVAILAGTPYNANAAIVYPSLWVPGAYQRLVSFYRSYHASGAALEINNLMIDLGAVQNEDTKEYSSRARGARQGCACW